MEQQKNWFVRHPVLSVLLGIVLLSMVVGAFSNNNTPSSNSSDGNGNPTATSGPMLSIKSIKASFDITSAPCVSGEVVNVSAQTLGFAQVKAEFRDKSSNLVNFNYSYLDYESFLPGQTSTFNFRRHHRRLGPELVELVLTL